jgi:flagellar assembly factor FliW
LPLGLLGFERQKRYVLLADPDEAPFQWFQMLEEPAKAFLVISPFEVMPGYRPRITEEEEAFLGLKTPLDVLVFNIVTLRPGGRATVNLKGPIMLNRHTLLGKQIVPVNAADFALHYPLPAVEEPVFF